jgi:hypothetical protein
LASNARALDPKQKALFLGYFLLLIQTKESDRRFSGGSFGFDLDSDLYRAMRRDTAAAMSRLTPLLQGQRRREIQAWRS